MSVKTSGSFWKGTEIARRDQQGKGLLIYRHPLAGESSPGFPISVIQLPHVASRKCMQVLACWWGLSLRCPG